MHISKKTNLIRLATALGMALFSLALLLFGLWFALEKHLIVKPETRVDLMNIAKEAAFQIDADKIDTILTDPKGEQGEDYQAMRSVLQKIKTSDVRVDDVYVMVKTDKRNIWKFVVSAAITEDRNNNGKLDPEEIMPGIGEEYDVSPSPQMQIAFGGPIADVEPAPDKWGVWLSGYYPIYNANEQAVAIVGVDFSAGILESDNLRFYWGVAMIILGVLSLIWVDFLTHHFYLLPGGDLKIEP